MRNLSQSSSANALRKDPTAVSFALRELLEGAGGPVPRLEVEGVNSDSRAIRPGEAFFALPGTRVHGDAFVSEAMAHGAAAMVTDRAPASDPGIPVVLVSDVRRAYARAAAAQFAPQPETVV